VLCTITIILPFILTELSPLNHLFNKGCLSGPYLGKYIRDWNETWFIDRWQLEEVQCTRTIILLFILTELSPLNHLFYKGCLSGPYLGKYIRDWNETGVIDRWQYEERAVHTNHNPTLNID